MTAKLVRLPAPPSRAPDPALTSLAKPPMSIAEVAAAIRDRTGVADREFDRFLPHELAAVSDRHWTPLVTAVRAAKWLDDLAIGTVLDIGSGAGKFCVAAALASRARFTGLEQRPRLVAAARKLARGFGVGERVSFVTGLLTLGGAPAAEAYYLYNPFGENLFGPHDRIDGEVKLGVDRYVRDVTAVEDLLHRAPVGTYVLTYNGFGGRVPSTYIEFRVDHTLPNLLQMWRKTRL